MKIRVEFEDKKELDGLLIDLKKTYNIRYISKFYYNRPPNKSKRVYIELDKK